MYARVGSGRVLCSISYGCFCGWLETISSLLSLYTALTGCLTLLEILEIYWNNFSLLEILEISKVSWKFSG